MLDKWPSQKLTPRLPDCGLLSHPDSSNQVLENYPCKSLCKTCLPIQVPKKSGTGLGKTSGSYSLSRDRHSQRLIASTWSLAGGVSIHAPVPRWKPALSFLLKLLPSSLSLLVPPWKSTPIFTAKRLKENQSLFSSQSSFPKGPLLTLTLGTTERGQGDSPT